MEIGLGFSCLFFFALFWRISRHFYIDENKGIKRTLGWVFFALMTLDSLMAAVICFQPDVLAGTIFDVAYVAAFGIPFYTFLTVVYYFSTHQKAMQQKKDENN